MKGKRGQDLLEAVRNAATGYTVVILSIVCFIVFLMFVVAVVRFVVGNSHPPSTATTGTSQTATVQTAPAASSDALVWR